MEKDIIDLSEQMRNVAQECKLAAYMLEHKQYDKQKLKEINEHIRNIDEQYYDCEEYTLLKKWLQRLTMITKVACIKLLMAISMNRFAYTKAVKRCM